MRKRISTTLSYTLVIAIVALSALTEANARVCMHYVGGDCIFWSGSVEGVLTARKLGDMEKNAKSLGFTVSPKKGGLLFCKNSDNTVPKIFVIDALVDKFTGSVDIKQKDADKDASKVKVFARLKKSQLRKLDKYCDDSNLEAIDFVPIGFDVKVFLKEKESDKNLDTAEFNCMPLGWKTLKWKKNKPERRVYKCKLQK